MNTALKLAILVSGKTQTEIARKSGVSEARLSRIIRGYTESYPDERVQLARALRTTVEAIFPEVAA